MRLSVVIPCYNEEPALASTVGQVRQLLDALRAKGKVTASNLWLIDDGSRDGTWKLIEQLAAQHADVIGVKLSRNRGHQNALLAGLMSADGDAVITLDADLQDDIAVVEEMLDAHLAGSEVVFGVRRSRVQDSFFKRWSARRYYALLRVLGVEVVPDHAEFRLLGRAALGALAEYPETNLFLRGLIPQLGFRSARVFYDRRLRVGGKKPSIRCPACWGLAIDGVTSFSAVPLRMIAATGALLFLVAMGVSLWVLGGEAVYRPCHPRLGVYHAAHLCPGRGCSCCRWPGGRVRGQDLCRGETPAALHHRTDDFRPGGGGRPDT